jgi:hypothetical protein
VIELLRELLHRKPFRPIRIVTRSGKRYDVSDQLRVAIGKSRLMVVSDRMTELKHDEVELVYEPRCARH